MVSRTRAKTSPRGIVGLLEVDPRNAVAVQVLGKKVNIRCWWRPERGGELKPTRRGVTFSAAMARAVAALLKQASEKLEQA